MTIWVLVFTLAANLSSPVPWQIEIASKTIYLEEDKCVETLFRLKAYYKQKGMFISNDRCEPYGT